MKWGILIFVLEINTTTKLCIFLKKCVLRLPFPDTVGPINSPFVSADFRLFVSRRVTQDTSAQVSCVVTIR
jgi:hypothetical protein